MRATDDLADRVMATPSLPSTAKGRDSSATVMGVIGAEDRSRVLPGG